MITRSPYVLFVFSVLGCAWSHAQPALFEEDSTIQFDANNVRVEWALTNSPAALVKTFRKVPTAFSTATVSNLLALAGLSERDRVLEHGTRDPAAVRFVSKTRKRNWLLLMPSEGYAKFTMDWPNKDGHKGDLVPSVNEIIERGSNLLATLFGITGNEFARRPDGKLQLLSTSGTHESNDPQTKERVTCVTHREISFHRAIDGSLVLPPGATADVDFGDHGKVYRLELKWPKLEELQTITGPSLNYFKQTVEKGSARWVPPQVETVRQVTLNRVDYCYVQRGGAGVDSRFVPIVRLSGLASDGKTNAPVFLFCELPQH